MELWLNCIDSLPENIPEDIDFVLTTELRNSECPNITLNKEQKLEKNGKEIGLMINISSENEQNHALSLIGSVNWLLLKCDNWKMIPCENLIAAAESSGTKSPKSPKISKKADAENHAKNACEKARKK